MRILAILSVLAVVLAPLHVGRAEDEAETLSEALTAPSDHDAEAGEEPTTRPEDDQAGVPRPPHVMEVPLTTEADRTDDQPAVDVTSAAAEDDSAALKPADAPAAEDEQTAPAGEPAEASAPLAAPSAQPATPAHRPAADYLPTNFDAPASPVVEYKPQPLQNTHVVLLVDRSASMVGHLEWVKSDVLETLDARLGGNCRVLVVTFDGNRKPTKLSADFQHPYEDSRMDMNKLRGFRAAGNTNIAAGLSLAYRELAGSEASQRAIILFSDGLFSFADVTECVNQHDRARSVPIHTRLFGQEAPRAGILRRLAHMTGGHFTHVTAGP
jgi:Mg-chelatase subunit ChlD